MHGARSRRRLDLPLGSTIAWDIFADLCWEDKPYNVCPRQALKRAIRDAEQAGYVGYCGIEPEFIAMCYDDDGKPVKAIDDDPLRRHASTAPGLWL